MTEPTVATPLTPEEAARQVFESPEFSWKTRELINPIFETPEFLSGWWPAVWNPIKGWLRSAFEWLAELLSDLLPTFSDVSPAGVSMGVVKILAWILVGVVAVRVALFIVRARRRRAEKLFDDASVLSKGDSASTFEDASAMLVAGDHLSAVRTALSALFVALNASNYLRIERGKTNMGFALEIARVPDVGGPFASLVNMFDSVFYGTTQLTAASAEQFVQRARQLAVLAARLRSEGAS